MNGKNEVLKQIFNTELSNVVDIFCMYFPNGGDITE